VVASTATGENCAAGNGAGSGPGSAGIGSSSKGAYAEKQLEETIAILDFFALAAGNQRPSTAYLPIDLTQTVDLSVDRIPSLAKLWVASSKPGSSATQARSIDIAGQGLSPTPFSFEFGATAFGVFTEEDNTNLLLFGVNSEIDWYQANVDVSQAPTNQYEAGEFGQILLQGPPSLIESDSGLKKSVFLSSAGISVADGIRDVAPKTCQEKARNAIDVAIEPTGDVLVLGVDGPDSTIERCRIPGDTPPLSNFQAVSIAASYSPVDAIESFEDECAEDEALCVQNENLVVVVGQKPGAKNGTLFYFPDGDLSNPIEKTLAGFIPTTVAMYGQTQFAFVAGKSGSASVIRLYDVVTDDETKQFLSEITLVGKAPRRAIYCCQNLHVLSDN